MADERLAPHTMTPAVHRSAVLGSPPLPRPSRAMSNPDLFQTSYAVVVGIDTYGDGIPRLRTAGNDARRVAKTLAEQHGYEVIQLIDADATRERVTKLLTSELPSRVGANDRVLFYWAGHGVALDGDTGPNGYLLPSDARRDDDASFLYMPFVYDALTSLTCRHMLVVLDACFSGAFRWSSTRAIVQDNDVLYREKFERFVRDPAWQLITSAAQDETALDQLSAGPLGSRDGDDAHSPFAMAFFTAINGGADLMGGDGIVTAAEAFVYLDEALQEASITAGKRQTPGLWPMRKHDKGQYIFFVPGRDPALPDAPPLSYDSNPWRGLSSYERADAPLFFGRDEAIASLSAFVAAQPLTVVLGASGSGKSSLVKAGVVPRLESDTQWHVLPPIRPGVAPLTSIADGLSSLTMTSERPKDIDDVVATVRHWCATNPDRRLVLIVDQAEELVSMIRVQAERDAFITLIARILDANGDRVRVIMTLRTDFEPQFDHAALASRWTAARFVVPPMSRADLQAVIEEPAARRVLYFDPPELVDTLLDEVTNMPGALPLLSFALSEMYVRYLNRRGTDRAVSREDYEQLGGVVGALRSRADEEYNALDEPHRATMQAMLLRMVAGGSGVLARRRVSNIELVHANADENARVADVRRALVSARLLVEGKDADGEPYLEPAHDALVRSWGRLLQWIQQAGDDVIPLVTRQKLAAEALEWRRAADNAARDGLLWKDPVRSAMLVRVAREDAPWLNEVELEFARASVQGRRRARLARRGVVAAIAVLALASLVFADQSRRQTRVAVAARDTALRALAKADSEKNRADSNGKEATKNFKLAATNETTATRNAALAAKNETTATKNAMRADSAARRAEGEKVHAMQSLFRSLTVSMPPDLVTAGSVCIKPACGAPRIDDPGAWSVLASIPEDVPGYASCIVDQSDHACHMTPRPADTRDFIVAREYGSGHIIAYAHDGMTADNVLRKAAADNVLVIENALRWLMPTALDPTCGHKPPTIVLWEGYVNLGQNLMMASLRKRGWNVVAASVPPTAAKIEKDLQCASVLWFGNVPPRDLEPGRPSATPPDFARAIVPVIEAFVRRGGGLLVAGLGWSFYGYHPEPGRVQPADMLGEHLGFRFTRNMFQPQGLIPLLTPPPSKLDAMVAPRNVRPTP